MKVSSTIVPVMEVEGTAHVTEDIEGSLLGLVEPRETSRCVFKVYESGGA